MAFSKLKAFLKKGAARTKDDLWDAIAEAIETFTTIECEKYFPAAGYDRDRSENALEGQISVSPQFGEWTANPTICRRTGRVRQALLIEEQCMLLNPQKYRLHITIQIL